MLKIYNNFKLLVYFSILIRVSIFIIAIFINFYDQKGNVLSPLVEQKGIDTPFYQKTAEQYKTIGLSIIFSKTKNFYEDVSIDHNKMSPLPLFPLSLILFNYQEGNTLPLSVIYLFMCVSICIIWLNWLKEKGLPNWSLWLFAVIPNPIYYMLAISTDLMFAFFFSLFFTSYFNQKTNRNRNIWIFAIIMMSILRPNAISVILFVLYDKFFSSKNLLNKNNFKFVLLGTFIILILSVFSLPYLLVPISHDVFIDYFGISNAEYFSGIFPQLPEVLDRSFSFIAFIFAKVLYFTGLRPSWADISTITLFLRSFVGIFLLPGFLFLYIRGDNRIKILFTLFIIPIFLVVTQDRYNLAVYPILYFYGVVVISSLFLKIKKRLLKLKT